MEALNVGLVGFGTVGTGVARILIENGEWLQRRSGLPIRLKAIADLDLDRDRGLCLDGIDLTRDVEDILQDPDIHVVIELIGGIEPARGIMLRAISRGKHVVTANKALLASRGEDIFQAAATANLHVGFEASVAGGIPILRSIRDGLASDRIRSIAGIINGTSNYILSSMARGGLEFEVCLRDAQAKGFAEADPTLDVSGQDAMHKLVILVALAHGIRVDPGDVYTEGIQGITGMDIRYAEKLGYCIKLLALSGVQDGEISVRVHPTMIPRDHMLAKVDQAFNAIYVTGENTGPVMFFGKGAGMMPTGSAVVSDLVEIARAVRLGCDRHPPPLGFFESLQQHGTPRRMDDLLTRYYIRFPVLDRPGVLSKISGVLGEHDISIHSVIQQGRQKKGPVPVIMLTHEARERDLRMAMAEINRLDVVVENGFFIRIEDSLDDKS